MSLTKEALGIFTIAAFIWMMGTSAKAVTFTEQNFELQFPPGWETVTPTPAGALMVTRSSDQSKVVVANATELSASERAVGIANALDGAKEKYVQNGWPTDPEQSLTVNGVPFRYFVGHPTTTNSMATYAAVAGNKLYIFALVNKTGEASTDPELQSVIQSFHLITPAEIPRSVDATASAAYNAGYRVGLVLGGLLCLAIPISIVVLLVRFVFLKPKTSSTGQAPPTLPPQAPS